MTSDVGEIINRAASDFYRSGPQQGGPAGHVIAALGSARYYINEDVTSLAHELHRLARQAEVALPPLIADLNEWAGSHPVKQRQVQALCQIAERARQLLRRPASPCATAALSLQHSTGGAHE